MSSCIEAQAAPLQLAEAFIEFDTSFFNRNDDSDSVVGNAIRAACACRLSPKVTAQCESSADTLSGRIGAVTVLATFVALIGPGKGASTWAAASIHFAPLPYNVFLVVSVGRASQGCRLAIVASLGWLAGCDDCGVGMNQQPVPLVAFGLRCPRSCREVFWALKARWAPPPKVTRLRTPIASSPTAQLSQPNWMAVTQMPPSNC